MLFEKKLNKIWSPLNNASLGTLLVNYSIRTVKSDVLTFLKQNWYYTRTFSDLQRLGVTQRLDQFGRKRYQMKRDLMGYRSYLVLFKNVLFNVNYWLSNSFITYVWSKVNLFFVTQCKKSSNIPYSRDNKHLFENKHVTKFLPNSIWASKLYHFNVQLHLFIFEFSETGPKTLILTVLKDAKTILPLSAVVFPSAVAWKMFKQASVVTTISSTLCAALGFKLCQMKRLIKRWDHW